MPIIRNKWARRILTAVALVLLLDAGWRLAQYFQKPDIPAGMRETVWLTPEPDCNVTERICQATGPDVRLRLQLGPPVSVMRSFPIRVKLDGDYGEVEQVSVLFTMEGMNMGLNWYRLKEGRAGRWIGQAMLPVCTSGRTDWIARVSVRAGRRDWKVEFPFEAESLE